MSNVGKSILAAALCRIFYRDGYRVAPFKSQNMALNSYVTADGLEMSRAQVLQAEASGVEPDVRMNPILLKPTGDMGSQVIVNGKPIGDMPAREYFKIKKSLIPSVMEAYDSLALENDIIVIEGAGSPAEINLRKDDIVNMGLAGLLDAPVILVGDIDPGGVFAQLYGTMELLSADERDRVIGVIVNKFRGDMGLFEPGVRELEKLCGVPVLGVVPYMDIELDAEDSLSLTDFRESRTDDVHAGNLERSSTYEVHAGYLDGSCIDEVHERTFFKKRGTSSIQDPHLDVAVIRHPHIANFTDLTPLTLHPALKVRYVDSSKNLGTPDMVILPGTKNTMEDLKWLYDKGMADAIIKAHGAGCFILGICGGYQMMGEILLDPDHIEAGGEMRGLSLLPATTFYSKDKKRLQCEAVCEPFNKAKIRGYHIHNGVTKVHGGEAFCLDTSTGEADGCVIEGAAGTYLHGLFDTGELTSALADMLLVKKGKKAMNFVPADYASDRERNLDILADTVRESLDMEFIYEKMGIK